MNLTGPAVRLNTTAGIFCIAGGPGAPRRGPKFSGGGAVAEMLPGTVKFCIEGRGVLHADGALVLVDEQVPGLLPPSCWTTVDRLSRYASSGVGRWP